MNASGSSTAASKATDFDEDLFETRLESLKDTQEGIQQMSSWCLQHRTHHKKIVTSWLNVFKRVRVEHRLVLFYLANDVIQYSKRKRYEFVESWATALQRATTMVRDEKVKGKILRIFKIWEQREIYSEEYLSDLSGLLNINPPKKSHTLGDPCDDFQNAGLIDNIRECVELSEATDRSFKKLPKTPIADIENIKHQIKDKSHSEDIEKDIERFKTYIEAYNKNLNTEIKSRKLLLENIDKAMKFYANQRMEVKVVVSAYRNFGSRIKLVKKKLDEITPNLPSPMPSPDINAPSPEPDADLHLPDDQSPISINMFKNSINGYSSYLDGKLPFDINDFKRDSAIKKSSSQPIEVIGSRSDEESFNSSLGYYKPDGISAYSNSPNVAIPGLGSIPVPPVQSEYTSLARSTQQYSNVLPSSNHSIFGNNNLHQRDMNSGYPSFLSSYNPENNYLNNNVESNSYSNSNNNAAPLLPPPPIPPTSLSGDGVAQSNANNNFNSTWDTNMLWTTHENTSPSSNYSRSTVDTPVSPPHFEQKARNNATAAIEFSEHNSLISEQDVDHRQLHLPPFALGGGTKSPLKDKTRQLDIDHRNLISLTGSPGINDSSKKSWLKGPDQMGKANISGDMDYRTGFVHSIPTIDKGSFHSNDGIHSSAVSVLGSGQTSSTSPMKSNNDGQKDDSSNNSIHYEQSDMVIDMDMSDEDLDDILKEVDEQDDGLGLDANNGESQLQAGDKNLNDNQLDGENKEARAPLFANPPDRLPPNIWDSSAASSMNMPCYPEQNMNMNMGGMQQNMNMNMQHHQQQQPQQDGWNSMPAPGMCVPPPPRQPFPMQFPYPNNRGRGRGNNAGGPMRTHRNFPRPQRAGGGGSVGAGGYDGGPYFNRGGRGGNNMGMRGSFRGKFRGNNAWI